MAGERASLTGVPSFRGARVFYIYMDSFQRRTKRLFGRKKAEAAA